MKEALGSAPQVESRREQRYRVYWRAQLHLPAGRTIAARLSDISGHGLGLLAGEALAMGSIVPITMGVPDVAGGPLLLAVPCSVQVVNVVLSGNDYRLGAVWVSPSVSLHQVVDDWIRKLRYTSSVIGSY